MAYIGNVPAEKYISLAVQHFSVSATTSYVLDNAVTNENEIALFINNVRQQPGGSYAYTATGTTLTLSAATAGTDTMYCIFLGQARETISPPASSVTNASMAVNSIDSDQYVDGSIDNAHIADDAIDSEHYATGSIDTAHIATNQIDETLMKDAFVGDFTDATVTASDYFIHGDATDSGNTKKDTVQGILDLVSAGGGFEVGCKAYSGVAQTFATATRAIVELELTSYDLNSDFNTTTDRYVVPTTGEYLFIGGCKLSSVLDAHQYQTELQIDGTVITYTVSHGSHTAHYLDIVSDIYQLTAGQYVQMSVFHNSGQDQTTDTDVVFLSVHRLS